MNILITGGSSGLGKATVERCAANKNNCIYFTYNNKIDAANKIQDKYPNVKAIKVDFCKEKEINDFASKIQELDIDILVNNAYVGDPQGTYFHKTEANKFLVSFEFNVIPLIKITQTCIAVMRKKKFGKIINIITSYVIDVPPTGFSIYSANKAYIRQLSKCWCKEYSKFNITSNCIMPDYMQTTFARVEDIQIEQMMHLHPLKRLLQPEEVADVILFIMNASQQLNGVEIPINAAQHIV